MAIGLAGCTAFDLINILRKKRQKVTGYEVRLEARPKDRTTQRIYGGKSAPHRDRGGCFGRSAAKRHPSLGIEVLLGERDARGERCTDRNHFWYRWR